MKVSRIGDWQLFEQIHSDPRPIVVLFTDAEVDRRKLPREELQDLALLTPEACFYEVDLTENPSLVWRFALSTWPVAVVYVGGVEKARYAGFQMIGPLTRFLQTPSSGGLGDNRA